MQEPSSYVKEKAGDYYAAISDYSKAIKIDPEDDYSFIGRAYSKGQIGDNNGAINDFSNAIEINSDDGFAFFGRAIYNDLAGNYNQACQDWIKASDLGYKNANKKANECSNAGNVKESINSLLSSQNYQQKY